MRDVGRTENGSVWMFMAATAMATTISTLAATAMAEAESAEAVQVTCECEAVEAACPAPAMSEVAPAPEVTPAPEVAPTPAPVPTITPTPKAAPEAKMDVEGGLDKSIIRRIVRAHIGEVRYCYNQGLSEDPQLEGRVVVQMTIGADGKIAESTVTSTDIEDTDVPECIAEAAARWMFPKPPGGKNAVVTYPFVLEPG